MHTHIQSNTQYMVQYLVLNQMIRSFFLTFFLSLLTAMPATCKRGLHTHTHTRAHTHTHTNTNKRARAYTQTYIEMYYQLYNMWLPILLTLLTLSTFLCDPRAGFPKSSRSACAAPSSRTTGNYAKLDLIGVALDEPWGTVSKGLTGSTFMTAP